MKNGLTKKTNKGKSFLRPEDIKAIKVFYSKRRSNQATTHILAKFYKRDRHTIIAIATGSLDHYL